MVLKCRPTQISSFPDAALKVTVAFGQCYTEGYILLFTSSAGSQQSECCFWKTAVSLRSSTPTTPRSPAADLPWHPAAWRHRAWLGLQTGSWHRPSLRARVSKKLKNNFLKQHLLESAAATGFISDTVQLSEKVTQTFLSLSAELFSLV